MRKLLNRISRDELKNKILELKSLEEGEGGVLSLETLINFIKDSYYLYDKSEVAPHIGYSECIFVSHDFIQDEFSDHLSNLGVDDRAITQDQAKALICDNTLYFVESIDDKLSYDFATLGEFQS